MASATCPYCGFNTAFPDDRQPEVGIRLTCSQCQHEFPARRINDAPSDTDQPTHGNGQDTVESPTPKATTPKNHPDKSREPSPSPVPNAILAARFRAPKFHRNRST